MKKILVNTLIATCFCIGSFAETEINVSPKITDVIIYQSGASVYSTAQTQIPAGVSQVVFTDITNTLSDASIRVEGFGEFTILNVSSRTVLDQPVIDNLTKIQQQLVDSKNVLTFSKKIYETEIDVLNANKEIKGDNSNLNLTELEKTLKFYQTQLLDLRTKIYETEKRLSTVEDSLKKINEDLVKLTSSAKKSEVIVTVSSEKAQNAEFELSYFMNGASWKPCYEIRVTDISKNIEVKYKAKIEQYSNFNWENVNVVLSTGYPSLNGTAPVLTKWTLYARNIKSKSVAKAVNMEKDESSCALYGARSSYSAPKAYTTETNTTERLTTVEFAINEKLSIASGQQNVKLDIATHSLPANYFYRCVPKKDKNAYLMAEITDFEKYNFYSGNASLYLEGKYVGNSYVSIAQTTDTLQFSLGRDNGIVVDRILSDEFNKKSSVGKNYKQSIEWTISVKNNKHNPIKLEIQDNVPVSSSSTIIVSDVKYDEGTINEDKIVTWDLNLQPAETKKVKLSYTVVYPKTMSLNLK